MERLRCADSIGASVRRATGLIERIGAPRFTYSIECRDARGRIRWREKVKNLVTNEGKDFALTQLFKGSAYTAAWFVGLIDAAGFAAVSTGDQAASHPGWVENTAAYSQSARQPLVLGTPTGGEVDNTASVATFSMVATATIQGAFVATQSIKGASSGSLYSASSFGTPRGVLDGDVLTVTVALAL